MGGSGRAWWLQVVVVSSLALVAVGPAEGQVGPPRGVVVGPGRVLDDPMTSAVMRTDAALADVCFVDAQCGWAVGDRGAIWHTDDGGAHWELQVSGVGCRLESVSFLDRRTGWAVGGYAHPYAKTSTGVVLWTTDGGRHWARNDKLSLPALEKVRFSDPHHGWALGATSAMFPSGVFLTDDGGRSWRPLPGSAGSGWQAGDLFDPRTGVLGSADGLAAVLREGGIHPAQSPPFGLRAVRRMRLVRPLYGWLVGDGGLVMMTADLGATWQTTPGPLPEDVPGEFDFSALEVRGPRAWVAGSPGTRVLVTADAGQTWAAVPTGQNLPIRAIAFADDTHGWAVGELGTILATADGGQTWRRQRSGGTRAALLAVFAEAGDVPLELLAKLSGDEGYLGVVELVGRRDVETPQHTEVRPADRAHEAVVGVGASRAETAWQFPLRQAGLGLDGKQIVAGWDLVNDGRGLRELEGHVVRAIRTWRPEVIVTHGADQSGGDALGYLVHQAVLRAAEEAADPTAFPDQITRAGLEPWRPKKVYADAGPNVRDGVTLSTDGLALRLGRSLSDLCSTPRGLVEDEFHAPPATWGFRLLVDHLAQKPGRDDFFAGIALYPGGEARRQLLEPSPERIDVLRRAAQRRRHTEAIVARAQDSPQGGVELLGQIGDLTRQLDPSGAAEVLHRLARQYYHTGQWAMAAETAWLLVEQHPDDPLARPALTWLVQYYGSVEAAWRVEGGQRVTVRPTSAVEAISGPAVDFTQEEDRLGRAAELGKLLESTRPALAAEPEIGFPLAAAERRRGFPHQAERFYMARRLSPVRDAWWSCAKGEEWLAQPQGLPPKPVLRCVQAAQKPYLDGKLDDAVWQRAKGAALKSPRQDDAPWPAEVMLAYDAQFLYVAVRAKQAPGADYSSTEGPRPRDPDLSARDRVEVLLDLDRDYATYYRLTIDHRGWVAEGCWGDPTWNPTWFAAAAAEDGTWTAEAAIPLDQLTGSFPTSNHVWAAGLQRTIPGTGFQSWTTPASTKITPEGFGLVIFE